MPTHAEYLDQLRAAAEAGDREAETMLVMFGPWLRAQIEASASVGQFWDSAANNAPQSATLNNA